MKAILLSGIAGAGKSTWANWYASNNVNTAVISTDAIRYELFKAYVLDKSQEKVVQKTIMERVRKYAEQGVDVIIDIAVVKNKNRLKWYSKLRPYYKTVELVYIDTALDICLENNLKRDRNVPEHVIKFMDGIKEEPNEEVYTTFNKVSVIRKYN